MKIPQCKCGYCTCDIASQVTSLREEDYLHYFLIGLDSEYGSLREQLLARDLLPSIDATYQTILNSERLRIGDVVLSKEGQDNVMAFKVQPDQRPNTNTYDPAEYCKHCNREGHSDEGFYQLIGYPEWWGDRPRGGKGYGRGGRTGRKGRGGSAYGRGGRVRGSSNTVRAHNLNIPAVQQSSGVASTADGTGLVGVTSTQLQQVLEFLNSNKSNFQLQGKKNNISWIVDTGDKNHVTCNIDDMIEVKDIKACSVGLPDRKYANSDKIGTVILPGGLKLDNVLYVPQITCNLISVAQMIDELACIVQCTNSLCLIQDRLTRKVIGVGERHGRLYIYLGVPPVKVLVVSGNSYELCHQRMGHPSEKVLQKLPVVSRLFKKNNNSCAIFPRAKHRRSSLSKASCIFELVHLDLWGPYKTPSSCGAHYFLTIINGIVFETSCVGTPQQNERVERKHQHIMNVARALRFQANLPIRFWGECALTSAYLINRTPTPILNNKTPYEIMFGKQPPYDHLKVFGCLCYVHNQSSKGDKFASRGRRCVFLGYPFGNTGNSTEIVPSNNDVCWSDDEDREEEQLSRGGAETRQDELQQGSIDESVCETNCETKELQGKISRTT
ncbi:uncharacterized protein LOC113290396 [Papaver somniferum]|uniref:uncharacterized protein LOC113290396 n=1 Tax=Papaver somniferum TaxID=3469 RepID=UPI000E6F5A75|nr:uncharacterized protein LOC113290396 [Papaver somniferum]